ncbi:MAG: S-layer protein [Methanoregula sp.]
MTHKGFSGSAGTIIIFLTLLTCSALIAAPVSAATKYLGGAPSFSAAVVGVNEFTPGEDATISLVVKNSGLNEMKQFNSFPIEPEDLPTTAKLVTIGLASAGDAVIIKTDPQMVGDISGSGTTVTLKFQAKISSYATAGEYPLPLTIRYKYSRWVDQNAGDVFEFAYDKAEDTLPVTIRIKPQVKVGVIEAVPEGLSAGSEGYIHLKIKNTGPENGEMAVVKLIRNGHSPIIPTDSTLFVGSFPSGGTVECRYKVSISPDATNQTYPVDVAVSYTNREGTIVTSPSETIGVPVNGKTAFSVISPVPEIPRGTSRTIDVQYRNDGNVTIYNAQARITPHTPITITDNNAFLGNLEPGMTAHARFEIQADAAAGATAYIFDSNIRYRDSRGNSLTSDTVPVKIAVVPAASAPSTTETVFRIFAGCMIVGIIIWIAVRIYRSKNNNR